MINFEMMIVVYVSVNIIIDGKMNDWKDVMLMEGYNGYMVFVSVGQYVNVYVKMKNGVVLGYGDYNFIIDGKMYYIWFKNILGSVSLGMVKFFILIGGKWNDGIQYGIVGMGYVINDGLYNYVEFQIDLIKLGLIDSVSGKQILMVNLNIGSDFMISIVGIIMVILISLSSSISLSINVNFIISLSFMISISSVVSFLVISLVGVIIDKSMVFFKVFLMMDNNVVNDNDNFNIKIDGNFNDWKNVILIEGYNGYMVMVSDGKYVYVYVKMKYGQVFGYGDYNFDIGGQKYYVWFNEMFSL